MSLLWQPREAAQLEYESLRERVLLGDQFEDEESACRFARWGLAGLLESKQCQEPCWEVRLSVLPRPAWTPYVDPREAQLMVAFDWLLKSDERRPGR